MSARHRQAKKLAKYRRELAEASIANLGPSLAVAGALAYARATGYSDGWGSGWDAAERYTRRPGWRMGAL